MTHGAARPYDEQALYTPEASRFLGRSAQWLYVQRKRTIRTGVQHGPRFAVDANGRPYYLRGWLLDYRRSQAIQTIQTARRARQR